MARVPPFRTARHAPSRPVSIIVDTITTGGNMKLNVFAPIELYVTALHRSALTPMPLSREARGASSETGLSSGFVMLSSAIPAALIAAACALPATAADYPTKPIRLIVGFAPGGGTDTTARAISAKLTDLLGQQIIIDNRPGAAGNIATEMVAKATPDGYTLLMGTIAAPAINPSLYTTKLPFDSIKDFAPIPQAVDSTNILSLHPSVPAGSVKELIALAKAKPLNYGSFGVGRPLTLPPTLFHN